MTTKQLYDDHKGIYESLIIKREQLAKTAEGRLFTDDEQRSWDDLTGQIKTKKAEVDQLTTRLISEAKEAGERTPDLGKDQKRDIQKFRLMDLARMQMPGQRLDGIVRELHEEAVREARESGIALKGIGIPSYLIGKERRDIIAGSTGTGQYGIEQNVPAYITGLYAPLLLESVAGYRGDGTPIGATILRNLKGKLQMPVESTKASVTWATEVENGTESTPTFAQATLDPKRVNAYIDLSSQLLFQFNDDIEMRMRSQLAYAIGNAVEDAAIEGGAASTPSGILTWITLTNSAASGQIVAIGASGGAPTWAMVTGLESKVENYSSMPALAYLTNPKARGKMKATPKTATYGDIMIMEGNTLNGYPVGVTSLVPSDLSKFNTGLSALIYGDWSYLYIGQWGGYDVLVDPYTQATNALVRLVVNSFWDVSVTTTSAFGVCRDISTT